MWCAGVLALGATLAGIPTAQADPKLWELVAHRGGIVAAPEMTKAAYKHMISRAVDAVEMDLLLTKDNKVVAFHDTTLNRTTDCTGLVARKKLSQIRKCDAGSWFDSEFKGERVLTLGEALRYVNERDPGIRFYLHMKVKTDFFARKVARIVRDADIDIDSDVVPISNSLVGLNFARKAGFDEVGLVFNKPSGWQAKVDYLIPYNVTSNPEILALVRGRGRKVLPVENHPHSLNNLAALLLDGVLANDVDLACVITGRLDPSQLPPPNGFREPESTIAPTGESRTTGPLDF